MGLVDDGVFPWRLRAAFARPGVRRIDHHGFAHVAGVVAPVERQILLLAAGAIAEMRIAPGKNAAELFAVGVNQQFVRIETVTVGGLVPAVYAVAVKLARRHVREIAVPHIFGALWQRDAFGFAFAFAVKQAQLDLGRIGREQGEIGAAPVPRCAKRMR